MANRLASETSPYLLQHKDNPVDWWPWCEEAFAEARRRDVPVLLSVGYASCHWCHVMERESFEDEQTAALMNERFVCIKVDREERPDIDAVYMEAVQAMTGQGGWPMTVFLTPDGVPFYGGTYFPPEDRHGLPGFRRLLLAVSEAWRQRRDEVVAQGGRLVEALGAAGSLRPASDLPEDLVSAALERLAGAFDEVHGGFGGAPKFPQPMVLDFLLHLGSRGEERATDMAVRTLRAMAAGGIHDQIGGGFARYSVDAAWVVPHFEKMLYDNAQLLRTYARAHLLTGDPRLAAVASDTAAWMLRELRSPEGAFYSSLDADSEGREGAYYVWTLEELAEVLGSDADFAAHCFGMTARGNFEGANVPVLAEVPEGEEERLNRVRRRLLEARSRRPRPATDDKVLASWNGLATAALAEAGAALGEPRWVEAAAQALDFVTAALVVDGRLRRSWRAGRVGPPAFADDHAALLEGSLALFEATGESRHLERARWAAEVALELFSDPAAGGFFSTGKDAETLVVRPKDLFDNAVPSANSALAHELLRLSAVTGERRYEDAALSALRLVTPLIERAPQGFGRALQALAFATGEAREVVVVGPGSEDIAAALRARFLPDAVLVAPTDPGALADLPLLRGRLGADRATAYVCRRGSCRLPVHDVAGVLAELEAA